VFGKTVHQQADFKFIDVEEKLAFSFFSPLYNSALYSASELQNIIEHEKSASNKTTA
jgi:hypothetical protein